MSSPSQPSGTSSNGDDLRLRIGLERRRGDDVGRQLDGEVERVLVADLLGHLAADQHRVGAAAEVLQHAELVLDLGAAGDEHERALDLAEQLAELLELRSQQQPGVGGQQVRDALGRRVRAVRGAERVVDVDVAAAASSRANSGSFFVSRGLKRVFSSTRIAFVAAAARAAARATGAIAYARSSPLRAAEVRADDHLGRAPLEQQLRAWAASADPRVVGDRAVLERHVQVRADEHALAGDVGVPDRAGQPHSGGARPASSDRSRDQIDEAAAVAPLVVVPAEDLRQVPFAIVSSLSKMQEYDEWMMSVETIGSSVN